MTILTLTVAIIILTVNGLSECVAQEEACDAEDSSCKRRSVFDDMGKFETGKRSNGIVLVRKTHFSTLDCITECSRTSNCTAINYRIKWKLCDLLKENTNRRLSDDDDFVYSKLSKWSKTIAGRCAGNECKEGEKCQISTKRNEIKCVRAYCSGDIPSTNNASLLDKFGLSRDIGTGYSYRCNKGYITLGKTMLVCKDNGKWEKFFCCVSEAEMENKMNGKFPKDCGSIPKYCGSGVYTILPKTKPFEVFCKMATNNTWHVIQNRDADSTNFNRSWEDYENGFGGLRNNMWLGLWKIHQLTSSGINILRVVLDTFENKTKIAKYRHFEVGDNSTGYKLTIKNYEQARRRRYNAGDSFSSHNEMKFTTFDNDNDELPNTGNNTRWDGNCALKYGGGWWYRGCHDVNLNGLFGNWTDPLAFGIQWKGITDHKFSLKMSKMMIRR